MIWSLTPLFQETEVLKWRLEELSGVVDMHVVTEATVDHRGNPRERSGFSSESQVKVDCRIIDLEADTPWGREKEQRNRLAEGLEIADEDVVLLSDLDEIPSAGALERAAENASERPEVLRLAMHVYQPKWRWGSLDDHYQICRVFKGSLLRNHDLQQIRDMSGSAVRATGVFPGHGWHMAFMGGPKMIRSKLAAFAHDELEGHGDNAERAYEEGIDLFGRDVETEEVLPKDLPSWAR